MSAREIVERLHGENVKIKEANHQLYYALQQMRNFMAYKYGEDDQYVKDADKALAKARGEA